MDVITRKLDSLCTVSYDNWKYTSAFNIDNVSLEKIIKPDYDDSGWQALKLDQSIFVDSCWIRKVIELPHAIAGQPISGPVKLLVSVDDYGYMWINGQKKGHFPWDGDFELTQKARIGQRFTIVIKAMNTGGPLRLLRAQIETQGLQQQLQDFSLSLKVGQKLLSNDTYLTNWSLKQDPSIDKSKIDQDYKKELYQKLQQLAAEVDIEAFEKAIRLVEHLSNVSVLDLADILYRPVVLKERI